MKRIPLVILLWIAAALAPSAQTPVDQTKPAKPDGRVYVENVAGSVTISGWDRNEVAVKGTLDREVEPFVFEVRGTITRIEVHPKKRSRGGAEGNLTIQVPRQSRVEVDTVSADVSARDISGAVDLRTVSGDVGASGIAGDLVLESVSGKMTAEASSSSLRCSSVSGDVTLTGKTPKRLDLESVSGTLTYDGDIGKGGELTVETVSGSVVLKLPPNVSAEFDTSTFSGSISSDLPVPLNFKKDGPVGKTASFRIGSGDGRVKVETFSGSVRFVKK